MKHEDNSSWDTGFLPLWHKVRDLMLAQESVTIDGITDTLIENGTISVTDNNEAYQSARQLIFAILGWQTMLYKPDLLSHVNGEFNISDETDNYRGEARVRLVQSQHSGKQDLPSFLLGFGMMLPPRQYCAFDDSDERKLFHRTKRITPKDLNAHVLTKVCGIRLQWVDSLSCHLELDRLSGTLFLYRYPSFCVWTLQQRNTQEQAIDVIHRCGSKNPGRKPWARERDIPELLQEILLSYRLLFGQSGRSRNLFRKLRPFQGIPNEGHDKFLSSICGMKKFKCPIKLIERKEYDLSGDFSHFRSRMVQLNSYTSSKKPRSIFQLWRDKRGSIAWIALWSVLIFSLVSILLGVVQAVFQILQFVQGSR
ncbi:hypothetical protein MGU_00829 [Metarhizium guizhouense ARSEF 977]|uniref:Uncharacterized protein n=1 Tax=Metarhizium guizhouense (strain ARSEF 977) TaxID=1276136 RepID=A0A0B4H949_METGA|nr:hypothetical protein MGU_00829 [Metarhizium guizhouense ARSEF 977]